MMMRSTRSLFAALLMAVLLPQAALADDNVSKGTVGETGYGKFVLKEAGGLDRLYLLGKKDTTYSPDNWRPDSGDQVQVTFFQKKNKLVASQVQLVKLGPNNIDPKQMVSPMHVVVREAGKSGIIATPKGSTKQVKFSYARKKTQYDPVGWVPAAGEEVEVEFAMQEARFTYDIAYVLSKIKRIGK
jgi:hypothetical protein